MTKTFNHFYCSETEKNEVTTHLFVIAMDSLKVKQSMIRIALDYTFTMTYPFPLLSQSDYYEHSVTSQLKAIFLFRCQTVFGRNRQKSVLYRYLICSVFAALN
ncbi:MAG: hypothetical protein LBR10_06980 [Prevotellaceae bacterium]|nr:hypothetical protein [Prevotellaceae bacterium]